MDRRVVQAPWLDCQQDLIQDCLAAVSTEGGDGDCCLHAANEASSDLPVGRVLQACSGLFAAWNGDKIL